MKSAKRLIALLSFIAILVYMGTLLSDKAAVREQTIRLHVVGASDSAEDQQVKLQVRDAVVVFVEENLVNARTVEEARTLIEQLLPQIRQVANQTLTELGEGCEAAVSFLREEFPTRDYESFRLPAGVYQALRITIGEGQGQNWWCVVFPSLCIPAGEFRDTAVGAGFSQPLAETLAGEETYRVRFFLLELLGKVENFFHRG